MVSNTRTAARPGGIRPLDAPLPVQVEVDGYGQPSAIGDTEKQERRQQEYR